MNPLPPNLTPQFSGHETFPLRQLWLRKAYDAVAGNGAPAQKSIFADEDAIVRFGVGRNMATSIRHWSTACDIITEQDGRYVPSELATMLFHPETGLDPYCEHPATAWLMHWRIAGTPERTTTWYFLFNHVVQQIFDRDAVVSAL